MTKTNYVIHKGDTTKEFNDRSEFDDMVQLLEEQDVDFETETAENGSDSPQSDSNVEVVETTDKMKEGYEKRAEERESELVGGMDALAQNPIEWLEEKNTDYVNTVKGTPAISKRGFRYIQSQFGISTQSEIIQVLDDPLGVIIWAKAELPDGRSAEAHGEGYQFEGSVDDNEFVRYADTRAKNRALADLTSSGALATEEME